MKEKRGIALVTTILVLTVILILASMALFLVSRGLIITSTQKTVRDAFAAAISGIERGYRKIELAFTTGDPQYLQTETRNIQGFNVDIETENLGSTFLGGGLATFARGYAGIGKSASGGNIAIEYLIFSESIRDNLRYRMSEIYRRVPNIPGG